MRTSNKTIWHLSILALGLIVFLIQMTFANQIDLPYKIGLCVILLAVSMLFLRGKDSRKTGILFYLYFTASFSILFSSLIGDWGLLLFGLDTSSYVGQAVAKFSESLPIIISILVLVLFIGYNQDSLYLTKGKLKSGLFTGLAFFIGFTIITLLFGTVNPLFQDKMQNNGLNSLLVIIPWALLFVFFNGFMEELLFRGLFLKHFESIVGFRSANILTALIFAVAHVQVTYVTHILGFIIIVFMLGLFLGSTMKKTNSIIAPTLIHAGADMMMILPAFINLN